jgi:FkbH-like protein
MNRTVLRGALVSDFNLDTFAGYLRNDSAEPEIECTVAPYGQITQALLDSTASIWKSPLDFAVVWSRPEAVLKSIAGLFNGDEANTDDIVSDVDVFCRNVAAARERSNVLFVPTWVVPTFHVGHGLLDLTRSGITRALMQANLRLLENLDQIPNAFPLNTSKWVELTGDKAFNPRLWYLSKMPFGNDLLKAAVRDVKSALRGLKGRSRKLIIIDLDDTVWGGIVGDIGWQNLVLGGHSPAGEAVVDFQKELKALMRRGIVLAIASKNEEAVALEAIGEHPEMVLRKDDFAGWRINWKDKAENIVELVTELNLGLESVVFIDDNPVERARVREALPEVLVPDWPSDKRLYPAALRSLDCFDKPFVSSEDRKRSEMYRVDRKRSELKSQAGSLDEWLQTLNMTIRVETVGPWNIARLTQLLNKTNQMNLSTRRMSDSEFLAWTGSANRQAWVFHVADRFGDSGLTGILSVDAEDDRARIVDFILSCRVMGRRVEEAMLNVAIDWARSARCKEVHAVYSKTGRNKPCLDFLARSGLTARDSHTFVWETAREYPIPSAIQLLHEAALK